MCGYAGDIHKVNGSKSTHQLNIEFVQKNMAENK
jgi:hypothetical protein